MTVAAIIQARMGSTRLPGKVLKIVEGKTLLEHLLLRLNRAKTLDKIMMATTENIEDQAVVKAVEKLGVRAFRGSEADVLDRYYQAAKSLGLKEGDAVVRVTGDCPLMDPAVVDETVNYFLEAEGAVDYVSKPLNYPEGLDTEVFSFTSLERAWKEAKKPSEREHVTAYIYNNPEIFRVEKIKEGRLYTDKKNVSKYHWSVDEERDFKFVTEIFKRLYNKDKIFSMNDILNVLEKEPELLKINEGLTGYEGYQKSLKEDEENKK